ncbi:MAG: DUF6448 family protein [Euryarchaeota archaeon]|nr:DUF6448 family protein [Euryarchaeota archaeon]
MPPHCDTIDGPVVSAARVALDTGNVNFVLIWVPESAENELKEVFEKTLRVRKTGAEAQVVADEWFFENVVRLHRAGEGAPFTGLKRAGLDWGPVVPRAEKAIETNDATDAIGFVMQAIENDLQQRFKRAISTKNYGVNDVRAGREFVEAYINFVVYSHHLYAQMMRGQSAGEEQKHQCA